MSISIRTFLLWALGLISIVAGWQGVNADTAFPSFDAPNNVSGLRTEAAARAVPPVQPGPAEDKRTGPSSPSPFPGSPVPSALSPSQKGITNTEQAWPLGYIGAVSLPHPAQAARPVLVAVLDTGIDSAHEDLYGKVVADISFVEDASTGDRYGHGTPIAGIIAADPDNGSGVAGLAPDSRLINIKVADDQGKCRDTAVAEGIIWAVDNGARVINISIELSASTTRLKEAVDYAWSHGAIIVAAAGNDGSSRPVYPAAYEVCLSVTAIRENWDLAPLANSGDWVDVAAPGFEIYVALPGNTFGYKHGTSFAAAYVSGLAALLFPLVTDANGDGNLNDDVLWAIYTGCQNIGIAGTGFGLIDVAASLDKARE